MKNLEEFRRTLVVAQTLSPEVRTNYCWLNFKSPIAKIRNTAIGTLLIDLSNGADLERAVRAYEIIMAPANYKRPAALITKKQSEKLESLSEDEIKQRLAELG